MQDVYTNINSGQYLDVIDNDCSRQIIDSCYRCVQQEIDNRLAHGNCEEVLAVAVASLQLFVECNWTGPGNDRTNEILHTFSADDKGNNGRDGSVISDLAVDGEVVYEGIISPLLLAVSRHLLHCGCKRENRSLAWLVWQLRSVAVHQSMISEKCESLKREAMSCIRALREVNEVSHLDTAGSDLYIGWRLEAARQCRFYYEHQTCKELLEEAVQKSGLAINLDGVKGKRTRYQQKSLAQLVLTVQRQTNDIAAGGDVDQSASRGTSAVQTLYLAGCEGEGDVIVAKNELMQDDTVLDVMELADRSAVSSATLGWVEQCLVLALCEEKRYVRGADPEITDEETIAYLTYILSAPTDWSVQCKALLIRSLTEKRSGRRIERSLRQLEELCSLSSRSEPSVSKRLRGSYTSGLPPSWQLKRSLGDLQMEIGAFASALEIFDKLCLYDPLIVCCQRSGRLGKAEELIRDRLSVSETAPLYCSLSDVTGDIQYYHKAWQLSNERSARAMRGLAFHHLRACHYEEAMECFEKTLAINPLQLPCWFSFGCSSLAAENYDKAATAFRRCVMLDEDNFEAWNNLAAAYVRSNQKQRAFSVLEDAIKCSYDNWKIWENYTTIGADCGQVAEVIRGAHRILELTGKWQDEQVVEHLTRLVIQNIEDASGQPSSRHREELLKLFGHATAKVTNSQVLWRSYGRLILDGKSNSTDNTERGIQCMQKAYRCCTTVASWEKTEKQCTLCTEVLLELVDAYNLVASNKYISTARLQLKSHISRLTKCYTDPVTKSIDNEHVNALLQALNDSLLALPTQIST